MKDYIGSQPILLKASAIKKCLRRLHANYVDIGALEIYDSISSTIDYAKQQQVTLGKISICLTEHQTQGRGRFGRKWYSPFAANIYLSLVWLSRCSLDSLAKLSLVVGLSVIKVLEGLGISKGLGIKWPNDILWHDKKLAGILLESEAQADGVSKVIISLGLNVNMVDEAKIAANAAKTEKIDIDQPWISVQQILQCYQDRNEIVAMLVEAIVGILQELEATGANAILKCWPQYDVLCGKEVEFKIGGQFIVRGVVVGINELGHLQIQNRQGKIATYAAGDVQSRVSCLPKIS